MNQVKKLLVVGAGSAGLISALILKTRLNIDIDVLYSKDIGIIGVGEGSTEHFRNFMSFVNIDQYDLIKKTDATYKSGIMFKNWTTKEDYLHTTSSPYDSLVGQYHHVYAGLISNNQSKLTHEYYYNSEIELYFLNKRHEWPFSQFHFNTHKLNEYLIQICKSRGIGFIEDEIQNIVLSEVGNIFELIGSKNTYKYDFYVDCTGFRRILMNKLNAKWKSYRKYLKMNSAIVFPIENSTDQNLNLWTLSQAMNNGWLFRIPVWGRYGNGYIFDDDYADAESCKDEVETYLNKKIEIAKEIKFDPGSLENVWIKNCCAMGLSGSFFEPLEASSIGTTIQQAFLLMHLLPNYDEKIIKKYNKYATDIFENILEFISLHYLTDRRDTKFWTDVSGIEIPQSLSSKLDVWKNKLPIAEDFSNLSRYILFDQTNFILVMNGMNLFNRESIRKEFYAQNVNIVESSQNIISSELNHEKFCEKIKHKEFISFIRDHY